MRLALFADVHANRQAFEACLKDASRRGAERHVLLGDYVGYGGAPAWCVEKAMALTAGGAIAVLGNHDAAISGPAGSMNDEARFAIAWSRGRLGAGERQFLSGLPMTELSNGLLFVHADASAPEKWIYVLTVAEAYRSLHSTEARITFCGHTHKPAIFSITSLSKMTAFTPVTNVPVPLHGQRRWHIVLGSVGQPRDGVPAASYAMFDTDSQAITFLRVPYDIEGAATAIRLAGLPEFFAERLFIGR